MSTKQALIVDDSSTAQYRLKKMLRAFDLDIAIVDSGEEALRYLSHSAPDVVFMDHLMPGMDGFKALQIIKSHPETATVPVIMYTSKSGDVYTGQARALGALDVVSKDSINATDLGHVLAKLHISKRESKKTVDATSEAQNTDSQSDTSALNDVSQAQRNAHSDTVVNFSRRASDHKQQAETRNVELRISHLEQSLEENRRFITARVVRELQSLRHKMKRELSEVVEHQAGENAQKKANKEQSQSDELIAHINSNQRHDARPTYIIIAILLFAVLCSVFYLSVQSSLSALNENQKLVTDQIDELVLFGGPLDGAPDTSDGDISSESQAFYAQEDYLNDLTWAFNQSGFYQFDADQFDPDSLIRLNDFFSRISRNGFKGLAIIKINLGNYCVNINEFGQAKVAGASVSSQKCMLLSEAFNIESIVDQYAENIQSSLAIFYNAQGSANELSLQAGEGSTEYPARSENITAKQWNDVARKNTFIEVELVPDLI